MPYYVLNRKTVSITKITIFVTPNKKCKIVCTNTTIYTRYVIFLEMSININTKKSRSIQTL